MDFFFLYYVKLIIVLKSLRISLFFFFSFFGNVNEYLKGIGLETILRNILWENDKVINFSDIYIYIYISHESDAENFLKIVY